MPCKIQCVFSTPGQQPQALQHTLGMGDCCPLIALSAPRYTGTSTLQTFALTPWQLIIASGQLISTEAVCPTGMTKLKGPF